MPGGCYGGFIMEKDMERISISILLSQLNLLDAEQDEKNVSTRSKMIRIILDQYFRSEEPEDGAIRVTVKIPMGVWSQMIGLIERTDRKGKPSPLFSDEEEVLLYGLRQLLEKY